MTDNNRIGEACWYRMGMTEEVRNWKLTDWTAGRLRMWCMDDCGEGVYPVAVVEDAKTTFMYVVSVELICFADAKPEEIQ